jgi:hypothetical protein
MATNKTLDSKYEQHMFLSQVAEEIGRYGYTELKCPICECEFKLDSLGTSYVLRCETDGCLKFTSRGI